MEEVQENDDFVKDEEDDEVDIDDEFVEDFDENNDSDSK
jgi:hypothetical protein